MKRSNPRYQAILALKELGGQEGFPKEVLHSYLEKDALAPKDQALLTELVYGVVRLQKNLDYILSMFSKRPLTTIKPLILENLRLGVYQIMYLQRVPDFAAVNEAVRLAFLIEHQGTANFTNALLRRVAREKDNIAYPALATEPQAHLAYKYSFPEWIIKLWLGWLGTEGTLQLCAAMNKQATTTLRVNTLKTTLPQVISHFQKQGGEVQKTNFAPDLLQITPGSLAVRDPWLGMGKYYIQDEGSALAAHALQVHKGQTVYDLCSAPGGKATHLAQLMGNEGRIIALDINAKRLRLVDENAQRLGVEIIESRLGDATRDLKLKPAARVLVDAPCSGLGTMGHHPDIRWRRSLADVQQLAQLQRAILKKAANYVQAGGFLVYSTCTITPQENEENAHWFLENHPQFSGGDLPPWFPPATPGSPWYRQFLPHQHGLDGFFVALFRKDKV